MPRWVCYILIALFSVQTFAAEAEVYQLDKAYLESPYECCNDSLSIKQEESESQSSDSDDTAASECQHCCHCPSCHNHLVIRGTLTTHNLAHNPLPISGVNSAQIGVQTLPYRPPKA